MLEYCEQRFPSRLLITAIAPHFTFAKLWLFIRDVRSYQRCLQYFVFAIGTLLRSVAVPGFIVVRFRHGGSIALTNASASRGIKSLILNRSDLRIQVPIKK